jgi:hypothetical protein
VLRTQRARQAAERLAAGKAWRDSDLIFTSLTGTPLDPKAVHRYFKQLLAGGTPRDHSLARFTTFRR